MGKKFIIVLLMIFLIGFICADIIHDVDKDGIGSDKDNCPEVYNPSQADDDNDGIGNLCDSSPGIKINGASIVIDDATIVINDTDEEEEEDEDNHKSSSSSYNRIYFESSCLPNWKCTGWSGCAQGLKTRKCYDTNHCEVAFNKPIESLVCDLKVKIDEKGKGNSLLLLNLLITLILMIILIYIVIKKANR